VAIQEKEKTILDLQKQLTRPPPSTTMDQLMKTKRDVREKKRLVKSMESEIKMHLAQKKQYEEQIALWRKEVREVNLTISTKNRNTN
jgi:hypothetical protein